MSTDRSALERNKLREKKVWALGALVFLGSFAYAVTSQKQKDQTNKTTPNPVKVEKTEQEWKELLSAEEFRILRKAGTERPNGSVYKEFKTHGEGTYLCAGCDAVLFTSSERFDSHCGWPSFFDPAKISSVKTSVDHLLGYPRTEVLCAQCDGHLGHVFKGEGFDTPTDKRYCINGTVLKFVPTGKKTISLSKEENPKK